MPDHHSSVKAYRFGPFRLSVRDRILERDGERIQLTPKVIDTLFVLVENARSVVSKEALIQAVWPDVTVVESGLTRNLSALRKALEDGSEEGSFIETIPRRGYRFVADVQLEFEPAMAELPPPVVPLPAARPALYGYWSIGVLVVAAAAIVGVWHLLSPARTSGNSAVEPSVRIGEHLLYKLAPEETMRASEHFERGIAENPQSAAAHAGLSISLFHLSFLGVKSLSEVLPRAEAAARKALELDDASGAAHYAMAGVHMIKEWDFPRAEVAFTRAVALSPESVQSRLGFARLKLAKGEISSAVRLVEEALRLDPASPPLGTEYCRVFYYMRDFRRAESECRKVLDREPHYGLAHYYLALTLGSLGRVAEANESLNHSGLMPGVLEADRAWLSLRQGDRRPALAVLEQRRELIRRGKVDATATLLLCASLGRMDEAYEALEVALATRAPEMLTVRIEPRLDSIRADPRYESVVRRLDGQAR